MVPEFGQFALVLALLLAAAQAVLAWSARSASIRAGWEWFGRRSRGTSCW